MLVVCHEVFEMIPELRSVCRVCAQPTVGSIVIAYGCARGTRPVSLCEPDFVAIGPIAAAIKRSVEFHIHQNDLGIHMVDLCRQHGGAFVEPRHFDCLNCVRLCAVGETAVDAENGAFFGQQGIGNRAAMTGQQIGLTDIDNFMSDVFVDLLFDRQNKRARAVWGFDGDRFEVEISVIAQNLAIYGIQFRVAQWV